jgi:hypothetical protein
MDDKLNIPVVIYDEILDKPVPVEEPKSPQCGPPGRDGAPGKDGQQGKAGKNVVDKATTATINQIKATQEIQNKYFKDFEDNFTVLLKKIEFLEKKLSEFE